MKYESIYSDIWLASRYSNSTQINGQDNTYHNSMVYNILVRHVPHISTACPILLTFLQHLGREDSALMCDLSRRLRCWQNSAGGVAYRDKVLFETPIWFFLMMVLSECILVGTFRSVVLFERAAGQVNLYVPLFLGQEHSVQCRASHGFANGWFQLEKYLVKRLIQW